jgi:hypothetical protein
LAPRAGFEPATNRLTGSEGNFSEQFRAFLPVHHIAIAPMPIAYQPSLAYRPLASGNIQAHHYCCQLVARTAGNEQTCSYRLSQS